MQHRRRRRWRSSRHLLVLVLRWLHGVYLRFDHANDSMRRTGVVSRGVGVRCVLDILGLLVLHEGVYLSGMGLLDLSFDLSLQHHSSLVCDFFLLFLRWQRPGISHTK